MDFHLDTLLNLPNVTVFTCYQKEGFNILQLELLNQRISCPYCGKETEEIHQTRPILVRDLSICGQSVYLKIQCRYVGRFSISGATPRLRKAQGNAHQESNQRSFSQCFDSN